MDIIINCSVLSNKYTKCCNKSKIMETPNRICPNCFYAELKEADNNPWPFDDYHCLICNKIIVKVNIHKQECGIYGIWSKQCFRFKPKN